MVRFINFNQRYFHEISIGTVFYQGKYGAQVRTTFHSQHSVL